MAVPFPLQPMAWGTTPLTSHVLVRVPSSDSIQTHRLLLAEYENADCSTRTLHVQYIGANTYSKLEYGGWILHRTRVLQQYLNSVI